MSTNEDRKTCFDCEHYESMAGNIYGVCIKNSYIDSDDDAYLEWIQPNNDACECFEDGYFRITYWLNLPHKGGDNNAS